MKKVKIGLISVIVLIALAVGILMIYSWQTRNDSFEAKSYTSEGTVNAVIISVEDREIEIFTSADENVHIDYCESDDERYEINISEDNVLSIELRDERSWIEHIGFNASLEYRKLTIALPSDLTTDLNISTTNEKVSISNISLSGDLQIDSNNGDVVLDRISVAKKIAITNKNAKISGSIIGSWDEYSIHCEIKKGETNLPSEKEEGEKVLTVKNNNGDINISFVD